MRVVFMGTGEIGVPAFRWLLEGAADCKVAAVVTQPDKPAGRRQEPQASAIKRLALERGVAVLQPAKMRTPEAIAELAALAPELIVVMAYGQILPPAVLAIPPLACLNLHASLLPRWRGAAPIQAAIEAGDRESGITVMHMAAGLDTGDILLMKATPIRRRETGGSLHDRLGSIAAEALAEAVTLLRAGRAPRDVQEETRATYAPKLSRENGLTDWTASPPEIDRRIRAMNPWPAAHTFLPTPAGPRQLKVFSCIQVRHKSGAAGEVLRADARGLLVGAGTGAVLLRDVQLEGKKRMSAGEFFARASGCTRHGPGMRKREAQVALEDHVARLRACTICPKMHRPAVSGGAVLSRVITVGQAPGTKEPVVGRPFAWTAGKTLFGWFQRACGIGEEEFRATVYMAAVCRCFPGKTAAGGDRVPDAQEIVNCARWLDAELTLLAPTLVIPIGKLAIQQFISFDKLTDVIGTQIPIRRHSQTFDLIPLPHPSGASPWHRMEPGKTLLEQGLRLIVGHPAWSERKIR